MKAMHAAMVARATAWAIMIHERLEKDLEALTINDIHHRLPIVVNAHAHNAYHYQSIPNTGFSPPSKLRLCMSAALTA